MHNEQAQIDTEATRPRDSLDLAIVVLSFNTCELLRDCLHSVLASSDDIRFQVCVVDNGSTDGSVEMVRSEFPAVHLIVNRANVGFSAGNNVGLRWFGFNDAAAHAREDAVDERLPRYALLLNPDTIVAETVFAHMVAFMDSHPQSGVSGPRVRRPDGSLDLACRRSFPTPEVSFYRQVGLSRLFPNSRRLNAYNLEFLAEDAVHQVDSVVGAYMQIRREAIVQVGLLDEAFFMYGEDLDWAKRIKDAGWQVWYNGQVEITHVKEASSSQSAKSRIDFTEAQWIFYRKHYQAQTGWLLNKVITLGIVAKGTLDIARHLWLFCRDDRGSHSSEMDKTTGMSSPIPNTKITGTEPTSVSSGTLSIEP